MAGRITRSVRRQLENKTQQKIDLDNLSAIEVEKLASKLDDPLSEKSSPKENKAKIEEKESKNKKENEQIQTNADDDQTTEEKSTSKEEDAESIQIAEKVNEDDSESSTDEDDDDEDDDDEDEDSSSESSSDSSDDEVDLDELLNKAEEALCSKQKDTIQLDEETNKDHLDVNNLKLPKLNVGITTKKQLYFKEESGRTKLVPEIVALMDDNEKPSTRATVVLKANKDEEQRMTRKERQAEREKTTGKEWFDMPKAEITEEVKRDLQILKMRHILDRKRHYKKMGKRPDPKYFQIGTIIEGPTEFYSARMSRKERKQTIVDELIANDELKQYYKRKYNEVQERTTSGGKKHYKKLKAQRQWAK